MIAIFIAKTKVNFSVIDAIIKPLIGALLMGVVLIIMKGVLPWTMYSLGLLVIIGAVVYGSLMIAIIGVSLINDAKRSFKTIFSSK